MMVRIVRACWVLSAEVVAPWVEDRWRGENFIHRDRSSNTPQYYTQSSVRLFHMITKN